MPRTRSKTHPAARKPRPRRRIHEEGAPKQPTVTACPECGASYREGRWTWRRAPADARKRMCPACKRIADAYPAGELRVDGAFVRPHRAELVALLRHVEERQRSRHPLKRILAIRDAGNALRVLVTDAKLAPALGRGLKRAYAGTLELPPTTSERGNLVRVHWRRD